MIDTAERIFATFDITDELTRERGLNPAYVKEAGTEGNAMSAFRRCAVAVAMLRHETGLPPSGCLKPVSSPCAPGAAQGAGSMVTEPVRVLAVMTCGDPGLRETPT